MNSPSGYTVFAQALADGLKPRAGLSLSDSADAYELFDALGANQLRIRALANVLADRCRAERDGQGVWSAADAAHLCLLIQDLCDESRSLASSLLHGIHDPNGFASA